MIAIVVGFVVAVMLAIAGFGVHVLWGVSAGLLFLVVAASLALSYAHAPQAPFGHR